MLGNCLNNFKTKINFFNQFSYIRAHFKNKVMAHYFFDELWNQGMDFFIFFLYQILNIKSKYEFFQKL
jgi:hypothetical protein